MEFRRTIHDELLRAHALDATRQGLLSSGLLNLFLNGACG